MHGPMKLEISIFFLFYFGAMCKGEKLPLDEKSTELITVPKS